MNRRLHHMARDERGVAATEFGLILPMLVILLFSFYEAGRVYWNYNIVQSTTRDAARYAARMQIACDGAGNGVWTNAGDVTEIKNLTRTGTLDGSGDPLVSGWTDNSTVTVSLTCIDNSSGAMAGRYFEHDEIPTVTVSATAPYGALFGGLIPGFELSALTVSNAQAWTE